MKIRNAFKALILLYPVVVFTTLVAVDCKPQDVKTVENAVLSLEQIACIFGSSIVDPTELAKACKIANTLTPVLLPAIENLITEREGARKSGVNWRPLGSDAGTSARP